MTIGEQLQQIKTSFDTWAKQSKAKVQIASDFVHLVSLLTTSPGDLRVLILFDSEIKRGDYEETGRVDRKFLFVLSRGKSFRMDTGSALLEGSAGGQPLYDLIEEAREVGRLIRFSAETTEEIPNYQGASRLQIDGIITDSHQLEFSIGTQLPFYSE